MESFIGQTTQSVVRCSVRLLYLVRPHKTLFRLRTSRRFWAFGLKSVNVATAWLAFSLVISHV